MDIKLNQKIIQDLCGTVSFKRGDSFYRANKVTFHHYSPDLSEATVSGTEDFHVTIKKDDKGGFVTNCSCPKLASFQKDCQHIAATLISINEHQRHGTFPNGLSITKVNPTDNKALTHGLLTLFSEKPSRSSAHQLHFENREALDVEFIFQPVPIENDQHLFGVELKIAEVKVENIRTFLEHVKKGIPSLLSNTFTYDPSSQCFHQESDAFIKQLMLVIDDEKMYRDHQLVYPCTLLIPPSSWERIVPFLIKVPMVKLEYANLVIDRLLVTDEPLPLQFEMKEGKNSGYQLSIKGLEDLIVFQSYGVVLYKGKLFSVNTEDSERLIELKQLLKASETNQISIPERQFDLFLEKVLPGLKKLGHVQIADSIKMRFNKAPLMAKLYLDRVKNRLLAGLEFHYENWIINPLEERDTRSVLIRDLEKEAEILQLMEESQFAKTDGGYFLHNEELEYEFLYHIVPKLHKLVQIYATTAVRNRIFRENARPQIRVKVKKERTNWLEFKFELDGIPDKDIREVLQALEEKRKFYRLRNGSLLSLETREFEEIQRFLHALPVQHEDLESGLNVPIVRGLQLLDTVDHEHTFQFEKSFRQFLDSFYHPDRLNFEVPSPLEAILRDYQVRGYKWLKNLASYGFGGILADDMGLGKTLQSITFIVSELPTIRTKKQPILIVCPASLTYNWLNELMKFTPDVQAIVVDGSKEERLKLQKELDDLDVVITSYPLLRRDIKWFEQQHFHTVFYDEAQAFKNPLTQTARAVKRIQADHRFALTGTPVENSIEELWSIFHVVFPELFLGLKEFSHLTREKVSRRSRPFLLRRLKEDVLSELPEKIEYIDSAELLPDQKKLYAAYLSKLREDTLKHLNKDTLRKNRIKILAGLTRLRQICCHPALFVDDYKGSSAKFEQLMQILEESRISGRRVLIFSQFTKMLALIGRELTSRGYPFFYLDGQTPSEERVDICHQFNEGDRDLFLISLKAGGTGLNLTGADTVVLYDLWWNPAVEEQAADRAHRIGQTKVVEVIKLVARGTIEEKMNELQEKKKLLVEEIIDPGEKGSQTLTEEDIREILMV